MTLLPLQSGILYGPITSRRLGKSLGINLMPKDQKVCSFSCVYCHYGWTQQPTMDLGENVWNLPSVEEVVKAVKGAATSSVDFAFFTFSGNGEPTLYPDFADVLDEVVKIRDRYRPEAKVALLSNSTGLLLPGVRENIPKIDMPICKLDAGTADKFQAINRPTKGVRFQEILDELSFLENIYIQTILIGGIPANDSEEDLAAYFKQIGRIQPKEVHIYSIDRPVPNRKVTLVPPEKLAQIARRGENETGVKIKPFYAGL